MHVYGPALKLNLRAVGGEKIRKGRRQVPETVTTISTALAHPIPNLSVEEGTSIQGSEHNSPTSFQGGERNSSFSLFQYEKE